MRDILSQATFWVPEECYLHKFPRADFGVCFQNIQPSKWIKHAKKGEEVRSRKNRLYPGQNFLPRHSTPTGHVPWPGGPRQDPLTTWKRRKSANTPSMEASGNAGGRLASEFWDYGCCLEAPPPVGGSWPVPCHLACSRPAVPASTMAGQARSWCSSSL